MRIAIIGKGTSAIITALRLIQDDHDVEFFYDPDKKPLSVGESTTPHIQTLIFESLDITIGDLADAGVISYKNGIKYINWGSGESFRHHFHGGEVAFHFESGKLNFSFEAFGVSTEAAFLWDWDYSAVAAIITHYVFEET